MPELLEPLHQVPLETVGVDAIEVVSAKILVVALVLLQVIANEVYLPNFQSSFVLFRTVCR